MRQARLKAPDEHTVSYYHCISRVVNREFVFGDEEKEEFVKLQRLYEQFCGVRVLTYCVMSNHFHVLVAVPRRPAEEMDDTALLARAKSIYNPQGHADLAWRLPHLRSIGAEKEAAKLREGICRRMWDVSAFMKGLKQRFSGWFNRRGGRRGTLWEERFKSVLVEEGDALMTIAAYIDLNPVRAGIVKDPAEYRWCGYAAAMAGKREPRTGLREVMESWKRQTLSGTRSLEAYREVLFGAGEERSAGVNGERGRKGFSPDQSKAMVESKGALSRTEMLRCRVRHFVDGAVIGKGGFVEAVFQKERHRFGSRRKKGSRPLKGMEAGQLHSLRDLRKDLRKDTHTHSKCK